MEARPHPLLPHFAVGGPQLGGLSTGFTTQVADLLVVLSGHVRQLARRLRTLAHRLCAINACNRVPDAQAEVHAYALRTDRQGADVLKLTNVHCSCRGSVAHAGKRTARNTSYTVRATATPSPAAAALRCAGAPASEHGSGAAARPAQAAATDIIVAECGAGPVLA